MERGIFLFSICFTAFLFHPIDAGTKIAKVDGDDIKAFRAKSYVEPVNDLQDFDPKSVEVINVFDRIKELEKSGFDLLNTVPDNGATCSHKAKFYITAIIDRAKEQCDYCVLRHLRGNSTNLNDEQKSCALDAVATAQHELGKLAFNVEHFRLTS